MTAPNRVLSRSLGSTLPLAAVALALAACSTQQYPSDEPGTTPPVWTGSTSPGAEADHGSEEAASHDSEEGADVASDPIGVVVRLVDPEGEAIGAVQSIRAENELEVEVDVEPGHLTPGSYALSLYSVGSCEVTPSTGNDADIAFESAGDALILDGVNLPPLEIGADGSGTASFTSDIPVTAGALIISTAESNGQDRQACGVLTQ